MAAKALLLTSAGLESRQPTLAQHLLPKNSGVAGFASESFLRINLREPMSKAVLKSFFALCPQGCIVTLSNFISTISTLNRLRLHAARPEEWSG